MTTITSFLVEYQDKETDEWCEPANNHLFEAHQLTNLITAYISDGFKIRVKTRIWKLEDEMVTYL